MACYRHKFVVRGRGPFPLDMLRYDGCYPASTYGMNRIEEEDYKTPRSVELIKVCERKSWGPTDGRWTSFGWVVVAGSQRTEKID